MQSLLWPMTSRMSNLTPDGYSIEDYSPMAESTQAVLGVLREPNGKHQWNVYTRTYDHKTETWTYTEGLEFRHFEARAKREFSARANRFAMRREFSARANTSLMRSLI